MLPAIALTGPDDLFSVVHVVPVFTPGRETRPKIVVVKERFGRLRNQWTRLAGFGIDLDHGVGLMAALIVFEREAMAVLPPNRRTQRVRIRKKRAVDLGFGFGGQIEERRI